ncbi:hypothetical protein BGX24_006669 [Mortierella sp. AD032]|nr:hypothetical protein BGX24_006669 [Mortierella sp. AD032]
MKTWQARELCLKVVSWLPVGIYSAKVRRIQQCRPSGGSCQRRALSPAPSATNSPLMAGGRRSTAAAVRDRNRQASAGQHEVDRSSEDIDIADSTTLHPSHPQSDSWSQQTYPISHDHHDHRHSTTSIHTPPPLEPVPKQQHHHQSHTVVNLSDDALDGRTVHENYGSEQVAGEGRGGYDGDEDDVEDNMPLGLSARRFTVKRDDSRNLIGHIIALAASDVFLRWTTIVPGSTTALDIRTTKRFIFSSCGLQYIAWSLWHVRYPSLRRSSVYHTEDLFDPQWVFMILIGIIFGLCLVPFAIHHTLLIKANKTTIESFEKHKYRVGRGEVMQSRLLNVFDLGRKQNFIQVLGPVWYLWLVPVQNSIGNGWSFPASDYGKSMLQMDDDLEPSQSSFEDRNNSNSRNFSPHHEIPRHSISPLPYDHLYPQNQSSQGYSTYNAYDMEDSSYNNNNSNTDAFEQEDHYRRDSDESDDDVPGHGGRGGNGGGRRYHQPTPRRFRQQGFLPTQQMSSDGEEPEEYLYDSDEPATIHFTDRL